MEEIELLLKTVLTTRQDIVGFQRQVMEINFVIWL
jgi:hypothetical protein